MHGMSNTQTPETVKLMNSSSSLVHACAATFPALAGEMAGIGDTWLLISGDELATWVFRNLA